MQRVNGHMRPEHGLQLEETIAAGDLVGAEHLALYWWAWTKLADAKLVLDLGCGCGYGARILCEQRPKTQVHAFDMDTRAVNAALRDYGSTPNLAVHKYDIDRAWTEAPLSGFEDQADGVVLFDSLDMLRHRDIVLAQVARLLAGSSGVVFLALRTVPEPWQATPSTRDAYVRYSENAAWQVLTPYFRMVVKADDNAHDARFLQRAHKLIREKQADWVPLFRVWVCGGRR